MAISQFPPQSSGAGLTNDFIINKAGTNNNSFFPGRSFEAGGYSVVVTGSTAYDIYLLDANGSAVGYTNGTSVVASASFESISALGLGTADTVAFIYNGPSTNASQAGALPGAGPYLTSLAPSDLPNIDDTTVVSGGNFANNIEFSFISGTVVLPAKNVVVGSSTAAVVTRPDNLNANLEPYDLRAVNPGVQSPVSSNVNVLLGTVTAGSEPTWVTGTALGTGVLNTLTSIQLEATDPDLEGITYALVGTSVLPDNLTLSTAGLIAGTAAEIGNFAFTVRATDQSGSFTDRTFAYEIAPPLVGGQVFVDDVNRYVYHKLTSSSVLTLIGPAIGTAEAMIVAGGGGGGRPGNGYGGGGGAGGAKIETLSNVNANVTVVVGAGGAAATVNATNGASGGNSSVAYGTVSVVSTGGGGGGFNAGVAGGSGGGGAGDGGSSFAGGTGISGQGSAGGSGIGAGSPFDARSGGGGGGKGGVGGNATLYNAGAGGAGWPAAQIVDWMTVTSSGAPDGSIAGGGRGSGGGTATASGGGGDNAGTPVPNTGGGGRGGQTNSTGQNGAAGLVLVRYSY